MSVKKPTGITLSRSGRTIKAKWLKRDKYSTTQYCWGYCLESKNGNTVNIDIVEKYGTTDGTHAEITIPTNKSCDEIRIEVRGKKGGKWSAWSKKTLKMYAPKKPSLETEFIQHAMTKFTWKPVTDKHERPISDTYLQTILVQDCPSGEEAIASLPQWKDREQNPIQSKASSGSITPVNGAGEDTSVITGKSYARIVRVKQIGIAGETDWKYAKHVYADPYPAENISGVVTKTEASLNCEMSWTTPTDAGHPIDKDGVIPQWSISEPDVGMECRDDATFNSLSPMASTDGEEKRRFTLDTPIGVDKCLFLRVVTLHDETDVDLGVKSNAVLASGDFAGPLGDPVFTEAPSIQDNNVTIKASNGSVVPDSFVVDFLERPDGTVEVLGLQDLSSKTYTVDNIENARVGLKAYVGDWNSTLKEVQNVLMESPTVWWSGGSVPEAPTLDDFEVEQSIVPNTVNVTWKYSWDDADACEISWSTEPDAWISTEDPDSYIVLRGLENKLAIKGIEAGVPLYVRIRYLNGVDEDAILSPYSDIKSITVSTVPAVPTLNLEKQYFTEGEPITCSWVYITTDGTEQAQAQLAERIVTEEDGETVVTYEPLKDVTTEQKTALENNWEVGTQHAIAVSVANGSGNWSNWSQPVMVTIAEPVECHITETSLETETHTGNPIIYTVEEDEGQKVKNLDVELTPIQDLNGYSKPWAAGAGKNKVDCNDISAPSAANTEYTVSLNSASYVISFDIVNAVRTNLANTSFLNVVTNGTNNYFTGETIYKVSDNSTLNSAGANINGRYYCKYNGAIDSLVFLWRSNSYAQLSSGAIKNIMVEIGSTATTYEPYSNICPITGHDSVTVTDTGKNLLKSYAEGTTQTQAGMTGTANADGTITFNGTTTGTFWGLGDSPTFTLKAGTYTLSQSEIITNLSTMLVRVVEGGTNIVIATVGTTLSNTFTTTEDYTVYFYNRINTGVTLTNKTMYFQLEHGSTATDYAPYHGQSKTVTLPHTVYGAGVGVTSGEGTEKMAMVDLGSLNYTYDINPSYPDAAFFKAALPTAKPLAAAVCSCYEYETGSFNNYTASGDGKFKISSASELRIRDLQYGSDTAAFKTAVSGQKLCYELATPTDLSTTPTDLTLYNGDNVISSDGQMTMELDNYSLTELPMTVTVEGAGVGGQTTLIIRRAEDYPLERPEGDNYKGFKGETVFQNIYTGENEQTITLDDVTNLDDGAKYELYASVKDDYGQTDNDAIEFTVNWDHKAVMPSATVEVTDIATIEIAESEEAEEGDYVDIYRRSIDGTELIYTGAEYGGTYVDPYPTIGNFGYLLVGRNMYGDYIMATVEDDEGQFAWFDLPASYASEKTLIDFDGERIQLYYNVDVSHSWNKDFKKTKYLGGSIIGDYVAGVERTGNVNFVSIPMVEEDMLESMRRLAKYEGNCHIRTTEGSSFTACVQVSEEDNHDKAGLVRNFSMTVDKVEPTRLDGMTEEDWEAQNAVG